MLYEGKQRRVASPHSSATPETGEIQQVMHVDMQPNVEYFLSSAHEIQIPTMQGMQETHTNFPPRTTTQPLPDEVRLQEVRRLLAREMLLQQRNNQ